MKKLEGNKLVALLISAGMATTLLAACSINTDELGQGITDLGNAFTSQTERETERPTKETTETSETETTAETTEERIIETSPTPTSTPTPTPTPLPQRVDFSDYTEIDLTDVFKVTVEEFSESTYGDDNSTLLANFEGTRLVVTEAENKTVCDSIHLIVNGFYSEAEGTYNRLASKNKAEFKLSGVIEDPAYVTVDFQHITNGRVLSVLMVYEVKGGGAEENTVIDFASFDMLSGQYITFSTVSIDPAGMEDALKRGLENSLKVQPTPSPSVAPAGTRPSATTEDDENEADNRRIPSATEIEKIYLAPGPAAAESANASFATIYGVSDGVVYSAVIEINAYSGFLNRYGTSVFIGG